MLPLLVVDDAHQDALLAQRVLARCKVQNPVHLLPGGNHCLDYFAARPPFSDRRLPCLLFLDMVMSPVSGLDVLRALRNTKAAAGSVFVMLSGLADIKTIHQGYQLGAQTFLIKPLASRELTHMLNSIPSLRVTRNRKGVTISLASISNSLPASADTPTKGLPSVIPPPNASHVRFFGHL